MIPVLVVNAPAPAEYGGMLDACSAVVAPERCVEATAGQESTVTVAWQSSDLVQVSVVVSGQTALRTLGFPLEDPPEARWRTVGLVAGAMVLELGGGPSTPVGPESERPPGTPSVALSPSATADPDGPAAASSPPRRASATTPLASKDEPSNTARTPAERDRLATVREPVALTASGLWWSVGLGGILGSGLRRAPWRRGGVVRSQLSWANWGVTGDVAYSVSPRHEGLSGRWVSLAIGPRFTQKLAPRWSLATHLALTGEQWTVDLAATEGEAAESASRLYLGGRGGVEMGFLLTQNVRPVLGVLVTRTPGQKVRVADLEITSNPTWSVAGVLGIDFGSF